MLTLNSMGTLLGSKMAARLLMTPVDTMIGLGLAMDHDHRDGTGEVVGSSGTSDLKIGRVSYFHSFELFETYRTLTWGSTLLYSSGL